MTVRANPTAQYAMVLPTSGCLAGATIFDPFDGGGMRFPYQHYSLIANLRYRARRAVIKPGIVPA